MAAIKLPKIVRREKWDRVDAKARGFDAAFEQAPWWFSRQHFLKELDSRTAAYLQRITSNQVLLGPEGLKNTNSPREQDRLRLVEWARWWRVYDPQVSRAIQVWTDYGFGRAVAVTVSDDEVAQGIWDEFYNARRNNYVLGDREVHKLSDDILTDGELFLACHTNRLTGAVTLRVIYTDEITDVLHDAEDRSVPVAYKRQWADKDGKTVTKFYRDWRATPEALARLELPRGATVAGTEEQSVVILHASFLAYTERGWPITCASYTWNAAYKQFASDRAAVTRNVASVLDEYTTDTGSRGVEALRSQLASTLARGSETNPPPGAGSARVQNKAVTSKRLSQSTAAGDAAIDSMMLLAQVATGLQLPAFILGRTDMLQNKATAEVAMRPTLRAWNRYQLLWKSVFEDIYTIVMMGYAEHGNGPVVSPDSSPTVTLSSPLDTDFEARWNMLVAMNTAGLVDAKVLSQVALQMPELGLSTNEAQRALDLMYPETPTGEPPGEEDAAFAAGVASLLEGDTAALWDQLEEKANEPIG